MPTRAPEMPTTEQLEQMWGTKEEVLQIAGVQRLAVDDVIRTGEGWIGALGGCAMTDQTLVIVREAGEAAALNSLPQRRIIGVRNNVWKPRSPKVGIDPETQWWGLETVKPRLAYQTLVEVADIGVASVMEIGYFDPEGQIRRYGKFCMYVWGGSRTTDLPLEQANAFYKTLALHDPTLPIGVKNGLDGNIDSALRQVDRINTLREKTFGGGALAFLIYRGGNNATTPQAWEAQYLRAHELTDGRVVTDSAHGTECAHHPDGAFEKTVEGQEIALRHLLELTQRGAAGIGSISEASNTPKKVDPPIPHQTGLQYIHKLHAAKASAAVPHRKV